MNVRIHNRIAWDKQVEYSNQWTVPVSPEAVAAAQRGQWEIYLTPSRPVPRDWFPDMPGCDLLCLASGGGQQGPTLAAAGARVTVLDNSPRQLAQDRMVAARDGLEIATVEGDMCDLSMFPDGRFDLIVHPISNVFVADVRPVWREAFRVLRQGGALLAGFDNPVMHMFDSGLYDQGVLAVRHRLPYSDVESLSDEEKGRRVEAGEPLEFSHTLEAQIGGQIKAGFVIVGFLRTATPTKWAICSPSTCPSPSPRERSSRERDKGLKTAIRGAYKLPVLQVTPDEIGLPSHSMKRRFLVWRIHAGTALHATPAPQAERRRGCRCHRMGLWIPLRGLWPRGRPARLGTGEGAAPREDRFADYSLAVCSWLTSLSYVSSIEPEQFGGLKEMWGFYPRLTEPFA